MSPNAGGGGKLRGLGQWVQLYTGDQINFGDLSPYLTYDLVNDTYTRRPITEEVQIRPVLYPSSILFDSKAEEGMGRSGRKANAALSLSFVNLVMYLGGGGGGNTHLQDVGLVIPWSISDMKLE